MTATSRGVAYNSAAIGLYRTIFRQYRDAVTFGCDKGRPILFNIDRLYRTIFLSPRLRYSRVAQLIPIAKAGSDRRLASGIVPSITLRLALRDGYIKFASGSTLCILGIRQYHYPPPSTYHSLLPVIWKLATIVRHGDFRAYT